MYGDYEVLRSDNGYVTWLARGFYDPITVDAQEGSFPLENPLYVCFLDPAGSPRAHLIVRSVRNPDGRYDKHERGVRAVKTGGAAPSAYVRRTRIDVLPPVRHNAAGTTSPTPHASCTSSSKS